MTLASAPFFENRILNAPYEEPMRDHALHPKRQSLDEAPSNGRRRSEFIPPVLKSRKNNQRADKAQRRVFAV